MAIWRKRPGSEIPEWIWTADDAEIDAWLRSCPVPAALKYLAMVLGV